MNEKATRSLPDIIREGEKIKKEYEEYMKQSAINPSETPEAVQEVVRYLERLVENRMNFCETLYFLMTGQSITAVEASQASDTE